MWFIKGFLSAFIAMGGAIALAQNGHFIEFSASKRTALICLQNIQADRVTVYQRELAPASVRGYFQYADGQSCDNVLDQLNLIYKDFVKDGKDLFVTKEVLGSVRVDGRLLNVQAIECQALDCASLVLRIKTDQSKLFRQMDADNGTLKGKSLQENFNSYLKSYAPDTMAKVLNFSSGCPDLGCKDSIWIDVPGASCKYRKVTPRNNSEAYIDFEKIDFSSIKIEHAGVYTKVKYNGETLTTSAVSMDAERLKRGWELIPRQACKGYKREF